MGYAFRPEPMNRIASLLVLGLVAVTANAQPFLSMRLGAGDTASAEAWRKNFKAVAAHPGCCDEVWFSTGCGVPTLEWHRARAAVIAEAAKDCRAKGIVPSLQFQATIGHGDFSEDPTSELFRMKTWTGWTGPTGIETKFCNCPRQPAFLAYLREVSRIYAPLGFGSLWIDDDLRIEYHEPSGSYGKHPGCWCATCLKTFNAATGAKWMRPGLAQAIRTNDVLSASWRAFQAESVCAVAKAVAEVFHELSPDTMLGLQHASYDAVADSIGAILKTLHGVSGKPVGSRPGGGSYYDDNPNEQVLKSIKSGWFRGRLGNPDWIGVWTPEIESWPRTYYSRSPQGVLVEGFTALMYGMNAVSFFISNGAKESPELFGGTHWKALEKAAPVLRDYARAIAGCRPTGFTMPGKAQIGIRRAAIPVLAGPGRSCGALTERECALNVNMMTSADVQKLRDELDRRAGGLPAVVCSPFLGLMQVHVDAESRLAAVALVNTRISTQGPVRVRLRALPQGVRFVVWQSLGCRREELPVERTEDGAFVTIPEIGAWDAGYLSVQGDETAAIQARLDACFKTGGGTVTIEKGVHRIGGLRVRSNTTLRLKSGAVLLGTRRVEDYDILERDVLEPVDPEDRSQGVRWIPPWRRKGRGNPAMARSASRWNNAIIRVYKAENVKIVAERGAVVDGQNSYDPEGEEHYRGVHGISAHKCRGLEFRGYTIRHTGNWAHNVKDCREVTFADLTILGGHDGVHLSSCDGACITNCTMKTGDDCIAGFDNRDVRVSDCTFNTACSAFRFGGVRFLAEGCRCYGPAEYRFRGSLSQEEKEKGLMASSSVRRNMLSLFTYYADKTLDIRERPKDMVFRGISVVNADRLMHYNFSGNEVWQLGCPLESVRFEEVRATGVRLPLCAYGEKDRPLCLTLKDVAISFAEPVSEVIRGAWIDRIDLENLTLENANGPLLRNWSTQKPRIESRGAVPADLSDVSATRPFEVKAF